MKKEILLWVAGLFAVIAVIWLLAFNNLAMMKVFMPAQEQVRRETFEQSKAYRDGAIQELRAMQFEYIKATPEQKLMMKPLFMHKLAGIPDDAIPLDLKTFIQSL